MSNVNYLYDYSLEAVLIFLICILRDRAKIFNLMIISIWKNLDAKTQIINYQPLIKIQNSFLDKITLLILFFI